MRDGSLHNIFYNSETDAAFFHLGYRDFFPVILTFLRQLPVFGTFLSLPYISNVCRIALLWFRRLD